MNDRVFEIIIFQTNFPSRRAYLKFLFEGFLVFTAEQTGKGLRATDVHGVDFLILLNRWDCASLPTPTQCTPTLKDPVRQPEERPGGTNNSVGRCGRHILSTLLQVIPKGIAVAF